MKSTPSPLECGPWVGDVESRRATVRTILSALPDWFGIPEAVDAYVEFAATAPGWVASEAGCVVGFLSVREHFTHSFEIEVMGVLPSHHRRGIGRALVECAAAELRDRGVAFLQVKTLAPVRESAAYARTRRFYRATGFVEIQVFPELWGANNPALQLVRVLGPPAHPPIHDGSGGRSGT